MHRHNFTLFQLARACAFGVFAIALNLLSNTPASAAETRYGIDAELVVDDNINRGPSGFEQSDTIVSAEPNAVRSFLLSPRSGMILRGAFRTENYVDFSDLSNLSVLGRAAYRFQPNPGFSGASLEFSGQVRAIRHSDSKMRDGFLYSIGASVSKHITDRVRMGAGISLDERSADTGELYNLSSNSLRASVDFRLSERTTLYGSGTVIDGDHALTTSSSAIGGLRNSDFEVVTNDPVFAGAFGNASPLAYRIDAQTVSFEVGSNIALGGSHAIDFSARLYDTETDFDSFTYDGLELRAMYFYRFQ